MPLITRSENGKPLTSSQMDGNLLYLQEIALSAQTKANSNVSLSGSNNLVLGDGAIRSTNALSVGSGNYLGGVLMRGSVASSNVEGYKIEIESDFGDLTSQISINDFLLVSKVGTTATSVVRITSEPTYDVDCVCEGSGATATSFYVTGNLVDYSTVVLTPVKSGNNSAAIGSSNTILSNQSSAISGGNYLSPLSSSSLAVGGVNTGFHLYSLLSGYGGYSSFHAGRTLSGNILEIPGDCQQMEIVLGTVTDTTEKTLVTLIGGNSLQMPFNSVWQFEGSGLAMVTSSSVEGVPMGSSSVFSFDGAISNMGGTSSIIFTRDNSPLFVEKIGSFEFSDSWDGVENSLNLLVTGNGGLTIKWVFKLKILQTLLVEVDE